MIRILIFIFAAAFVAFLATALLSIDGRLSAEAFGNRYDIHTGAALLFALLAIAAGVGAVLILRALSRLPRAVWGVADEGKRARGLEALTKGFEAIAVGDGAAALRQAEIAERKLRDLGLTRLLRAQASLLSGDDRTAQESFSAMLAAPETEFLGLRGLFLQAERAGDKESARQHAARAFALRPHAQWAFEPFFASGLERGAWGEMRDALATAERSGAVDSQKARRGRAALLAADAAAASASGDEKLALEEAEKAQKLAPDFTPAAALAARLQAGRNRGRALKTLERAFAEGPHGALIGAANAVLAEEPAEKRAAGLERLAAAAPQSTEASVARALGRIAIKDFAGAAALIEPLLRDTTSARLCALMAEIVVAAGGADREARAREWLTKAAAAPREPDFSRGGVAMTRPLWARIIREYMEAGRLAPPPLDAGEGRGLSEEELQRLFWLAPTKEESPEAPTADEAGEAAPTAKFQAPAGKAGPADVLVGDRVSAARAIAAAGEVS